MQKLILTIAISFSLVSLNIYGKNKSIQFADKGAIWHLGKKAPEASFLKGRDAKYLIANVKAFYRTRIMAYKAHREDSEKNTKSTEKSAETSESEQSLLRIEKDLLNSETIGTSIVAHYGNAAIVQYVYILDDPDFHQFEDLWVLKDDFWQPIEFGQMLKISRIVPMYLDADDEVDFLLIRYFGDGAIYFPILSANNASRKVGSKLSIIAQAINYSFTGKCENNKIYFRPFKEHPIKSKNINLFVFDCATARFE